MAKALMLWPAGTDVRVSPAAADRLAELGVTSVALLRDDQTVAVVLDGWAFDPARSAPAAAEALGDGADCRVLQPALDVAVTSASTTGGDR